MTFLNHVAAAGLSAFALVTTIVAEPPKLWRETASAGTSSAPTGLAYRQGGAR
jgi:hypothetical protein